MPQNARRSAIASLAALLLMGAAPSRADLPGEPAFVRARPQVKERLETLLAAARASGVAPAARPSAPSPCDATDQGDFIRYTWTDVQGEQGYYVFRDGLLDTTLGPGGTSIQEVPGPATHSYCVVAFNTDGLSDACCDFGTQSKYSVPACRYLPAGSQVEFRWLASPGAAGYRVYRDDALIRTLHADTTVIFDNPGAGNHDYCVEAFGPAAETSDRCCVTVQSTLPPGSAAPCSATQDLPGAIRFTWTDVSGEDGYEVLRDGRAFATLPKDSTSVYDAGTFETHNYCVHAFNAFGPGPACCSSGRGLSADLRARLSWGTCSPQVNNQTFTGPGFYTLDLSITGVPAINLGHDTELFIRPAVPDAWRFDDAGCQTESRLDLRVESLGDSCPAMLGPNPLTITSYYLYLDGSAAIRLAIVYDNLATDPAQRYVLWKIRFDHNHSVAGTDSDSTTCDGASVPLNFTVAPQILFTSGFAVQAPMDPNDLPATWNGGQAAGGKVPGKPTTWGRVKSLYR